MSPNLLSISGSSRVVPSLSLLLALLSFSCESSKVSVRTSTAGLSERSLQTAEYIVETYSEDVIETIGRLVTFRTVQLEGIPNAENPEFKKMTVYLRTRADELGLEFQDHGAVVVIALGASSDRLGLVTHGDVQPADASRWPQDPFQLDRETRPDRLIARGTEDDKGPIAMALYAMKALADQGFQLRRRVELVISYTEESDWNPMMQYLEKTEVPELNIALDSSYPVVTAEKGFCLIQLDLPFDVPADFRAGPMLVSFRGGSFVSQIPEKAVAVIRRADRKLRATLEQIAEAQGDLGLSFDERAGDLVVTAEGKSAHSSEPEEGVNAISRLAAILGPLNLPGGSARRYVDFLTEYVGDGHYAERFGQVGYSHPFMGPLTLAVTTLEEKEGRHILSINLRRPAGKSRGQLEEEIGWVLEDWKRSQGIEDLKPMVYVGDPHMIEGAPQVPVLLEVFSHFTGAPDPRPISKGGGTHARLLPNGVSFGPHMPGRAYSGHTEQEYLLLEELELDLKMYAAMLVELAAVSGP